MQPTLPIAGYDPTTEWTAHRPLDYKANIKIYSDDVNRKEGRVVAVEWLKPIVEPLRVTMKKADRMEDFTGWLFQCDMFAKQFDNAAIDYVTTAASFNAFVRVVMIDPLVSAYMAAKAETQQAHSASGTLLNTYGCYTYMLTTSGKAAVLTDNIAKAELLKEETPPKYPYTLLTHTDAKVVADKLPYVKYNAKGDEIEANIHTDWQKHGGRRDLVGITFDPSTTERIVNNEFNIWRGWAYESVASAADLPFWELVLDVLCDGNEQYFEFVRKWLAHMVQKPAERPLCAVGISGPQGVGKSLFVKVVGGLMDSAHYNPNVAMKAIAGDMQGRDLEGVLLAYLDEASWGGDKLSTGALKKAITGETDRINEKFVPAYNVPTYKRVVFSSNESYYYHADADDRRLLPLEIDRSKGKKSNEFFQSIINGQELRPEVQQALLATLQAEDITDWVPHQELQKLDIKTGGAMQERSMTSVQRWLLDSIRNMSFEARLHDDTVVTYTSGPVTVAELQLSYKTFCEHDSFDRSRQVNLSAAEPKQVLVTVFGMDSKPAKRAGQSVRGYKIDWSLMQQNFQGMFKWKLQWPEPEQEVVNTLKLVGSDV